MTTFRETHAGGAGISRRTVLGAAIMLSMATLAATPSAAAKERSQAATYGSAPFTTRHLLPGGGLDLEAVDRTSPLARVIALTIDDGPDANDLRILDILQRYEARATFFYIGRKIAGHGTAIAAAVAASGNEVGSHSYSHPLLTDLSAAQQERELAAANAALAGAGIHPSWFRPPYGDFDDAVVRAAQAHGLQTVAWTADSQDWKGIGAAVVSRRVTDRLAPGAVVLMHGGRAATVAALPGILEEGKRRGFRFVTMTEWRKAMLDATPTTLVARPDPH